MVMLLLIKTVFLGTTVAQERVIGNNITTTITIGVVYNRIGSVILSDMEEK